MKKLSSLALFLALILLVSCKKDKGPTSPATTSGNSTNGPKTITGKVHKGPYLNGAPMIIYELNGVMGQTGKSFSSSTSDDFGSFSFNNINLNSNLILITANGYFYNEQLNSTSSGQLYLESYANANSSLTINVNLLTHIIKSRIDVLVAAGKDFTTARNQAQGEFYTFAGVSGLSNNFEDMELSGSGFLTAMSLIFQRRGLLGSNNYTAELSSLLSSFRTDFSNNGLIDAQWLKDTLLHNANWTHVKDVRNNLQSFFSNHGITTTVPNFEQYLEIFQKKYSHTIYANIIFPDSAWTHVETGFYGKTNNLLCPNKLNLASNTEEVISAIVPFDSIFCVKITPLDVVTATSLSCGDVPFGWTVQSQSTSFGGTIFFLTAELKNVPLSYWMNSGTFYGHDSVQVDYYRNNFVAPYFSKKIYW
ncbi:MAG: hypothetical protein ACXVPN_07135 [Bacteroidia bacterium]